jgi:N-acetylmuramoyl-L-alanine amidase
MASSLKVVSTVLAGIALALGAMPVRASETVCIDPGHPSETSSGAHVGKLSENHLNWVVANKIAAILIRDGVMVVLTKTSEHERVTNRHRAEIANEARAAMFLRLHCDTGSGSGFTWYYPDHAGTKNGVTGPPASVIAASRGLADSLNRSMRDALAGTLPGNPVKTDSATFVGSHQGGVLTGSIFARVPTALIEMCFLNNRRDAAVIASKRGQDAMAAAIAKAVEAYLRVRK